jgi:hypothetical protein
MSNSGQVLGYTAQCGSDNDLIYWTWDPVNGTQDLNAEILMTGYSEVVPAGVNDNGQILATVYTSSGIAHWGTLNPPAAARSRAHQQSLARSMIRH